MKYRQFITSIILLISVLSGINAVTAQAIQPDIKKVVTFVFLADAAGNLLHDPKTNNPVPYGTGFFVGVKNDTGHGLYGYLVTAKHVLRDGSDHDLTRVFLRLNKLQGDTEFVPVDLIQGGKSNVFTSPDPSVDIAVVPALPSMSVFDFKVIPEDMIFTKATFDEFNISEGSDIFFVGLFTTFYGEHKNNPIFRFGRVAMFPDDPIDWKDYEAQPIQHAQLYLIETQSYAGNSGSPVFFSLGSDRLKNTGFVVGPAIFKLAGIMRGRFNDMNPVFGFLQSPTASTPVTIPNIGIAAVTPSYLLHDILFSDDLKAFRAAHPIPEPPAPPVAVPTPTSEPPK